MQFQVPYSDDQSLPESELYSAGFTAISTTYSDGVAANWYGPSGLSWDLPAETYWLALEVALATPYSASTPTKVV